MEKLDKGIKRYVFHPGVILVSIAFFLIIAGVVGAKHSLAMLQETKNSVAHAVFPTDVPSLTPTPTIVITPTQLPHKPQYQQKFHDQQ